MPFSSSQPHKADTDLCFERSSGKMCTASAPFSLFNSAHNSSRRSVRRATKTRALARPASWWANSQPIPADAPVIRAVQPSSFIALRLTQQWFERSPDNLRNNLVTRRRRMNQVRLVKLWQTADALQQERNQRGAIRFCHFAERALESARVITAEIRRHLHSRDDHLHLRILRFGFVDDGLEVRFDRG